MLGGWSQGCNHSLNRTATTSADNTDLLAPVLPDRAVDFGDQSARYAGPIPGPIASTAARDLGKAAAETPAQLVKEMDY